MKTQRLFQVLLTATALASANSALALQESLLFECNEDAGVIGVSKSRSEFGQNYNTHPGFKAQSANGKYRTWTIAAVSSTTRDFEWICRIGNSNAVINVWHQTTPRDELIEKYGVKHESCGAFRKLRMKYGDKTIVQDEIMESDGCEDPKFTLDVFYFAKGSRPFFKNDDAYYFEEKIRVPRSDGGTRDVSITGGIDSGLLTTESGNIRSKLPITSKTIDDLLLRRFKR